MHRPSRVLSLLALSMAIPLVGCECHQPHYSNRQAQSRSLVFNSPRLDRINERDSRGHDPYLIPWFATRNDARLTTEAGYQSPTYEESVSYTYDRQYQSGGQVYDQYSTTTTRRGYSQGTR